MTAPKVSPAVAGAALAACSCAAFAVWVVRSERLRHAAETRELQEQAAKALKLRAEERTGRTTAERMLRQLQQQQQQQQQQRSEEAEEEVDSTTRGGTSSRCMVYRPIGFLESCFVERRGTPRQGMLAPAARSRLRILPSVVQAAALEGIEGFSHVWLIWDFHENTNNTAPLSDDAGGRRGRGGGSSSSGGGSGGSGGSSSSSGKGGGTSGAARGNGRARQVKAKIHPPGLSGKKVGLFATRTPHRPNPIGLSLCRLLRVEGAGDGRDTLVLGGADIVDGTPILDVKPYLGHDRVDDSGRVGGGGGSGGGSSSSNSGGGSGGGGGGSEEPRAEGSEAHQESPPLPSRSPPLRVPEWCAAREDSSLLQEVRFEAHAEAGLRAALLSDGGGGGGSGGGRMRFYRGAEDLPELRDAIRQALLLDIRSVHQGRDRHGQGQAYTMRLDALAITFETFETHVLVVGCTL